MSIVRHILFPVDFSESSVAMALTVKRAAAIYGARVTLLHVFDLYSHNAFELYVRPIPYVVEEQETLARLKLDSFLSDVFPLSECERVLLRGDAAIQITKLAREKAFDMIAMPTHAGLFRRMLIGSTTAKVLDEAECPVITTQHAETISPRPLEHRQWVCALGLDADSVRVLRFAEENVEIFRGHLSLVHVIAMSEAGLGLGLDFRGRVKEEESEAAKRRLEEMQTVVGSGFPLHIAIGPVRETLIEEVRRSNADALVIGRSPQSSMAGRLRDLTYVMVRDAPCPVLSV